MASEPVGAPKLQDPSGMLSHGYEIIKHLGKGAMGSVHKAKFVATEPRGHLQPDEEVAIKFVPAEVLQPREILIQGQLNHRNIIKLYDVFPVQLVTGEWQVCMVMELADPDRHGLRGPSLWDCMEACMETNMKACVYTPRTAKPEAFQRPVVGGEPIIRWIFLQVVAALNFMHSHPLYVANRDVKASNVLITEFKPSADHTYRPAVKVTDFGFADSDKRRSRLGTPGCIAPEVYQLKGAGNTYEGPPVDVWAAAVMLYELAIGIRPFHEYPRGVETLQAIMQRACSQPYIDTVLFARSRFANVNASPELVDLLRRMFVIDPQKRITMAQVIEHEWSQKMNRDIQFVHPDTKQHMVFPAWRLYHKENVKAIEDARANANYAKRGTPEYASALYAPYGWTMPHLKFAEVDAMLQGVTRGSPPYAPHVPPSAMQQHPYISQELLTSDSMVA